jgi:hypothetical protein
MRKMKADSFATLVKLAGKLNLEQSTAISHAQDEGGFLCNVSQACGKAQF